MILGYEGEQLTELVDFTDPEVIVSGMDRHGHIYRALDKLPGPLRDVAELRIFDGGSLHDIAVELEISPATARQRWRRARELLKRKLDPEELGE